MTNDEIRLVVDVYLEGSLAPIVALPGDGDAPALAVPAAAATISPIVALPGDGNAPAFAVPAAATITTSTTSSAVLEPLAAIEGGVIDWAGDLGVFGPVNLFAAFAAYDPPVPAPVW